MTIGAYGTGPRPIIDVTGRLPGWDDPGKWQRQLAEVWFLSPLDAHPGRIWLSGHESAAAGPETGAIDSRNRRAFDKDRLHVWALEDPATFYQSVIMAATRPTGPRTCSPSGTLPSV